MAVGRISGPLLKANLERNGIDLAVETNLLYFDVTNNRLGVNNAGPAHDLDVTGTSRTTSLLSGKTTTDNVDIDGNDITTLAGNLILSGFTVTDGVEINDLLLTQNEITTVTDGSNILVNTNTTSSVIINSRLTINDAANADTKLKYGSVSIDGETTNALIETNVTDLDLILSSNGLGKVVTNSNTQIGTTLDPKTFTVTGNSFFRGNLTVDGNITIGDANTDSITIGADFVSNLTPDAPNTYDLGTTTKTWRDAFVGDLQLTTNSVTATVTNDDVRLTPNGTGNVVADTNKAFVVPVGTSVERPANVTGAIRWNTTNESFEAFDARTGINDWAVIPLGANVSRYQFTATAGQTVFSGADDNGNTFSTVPGGTELVFQNGQFLEETAEYSTTDTSLTLVTGATAGDDINVVVIGTFKVGDVVSKSVGGTFDAGIVIDGNLRVLNNIIADGSVSIGDRIVSIGTGISGTAPPSDDNQDRGINFKWHDGISAKNGFFGFDDSTGFFTFIPDATITGEVASGVQGDIQATTFRGNIVASDISSGTLSLTTALPVTSGGTGLATATTGDILFSDAANSLTSLAIGTANSILTSNGTAPIWSSSLDLSGIINQTNVTQSTSVDTGAIITDGGAGIAQNLYVGGLINVAGVFNQTDATQSTSTATGAITTAGGAGIAQNLYVGGLINVAGVFNQSDATQSTSTATGAITTAGGAGIAKNLFVGGTANVAGDLIVNGNTNINSASLTTTSNTLILADGSADALAADSAGIVVDLGTGGTATLTYASATDRFVFNKNVEANTFVGALTGNADTATAWQTGRTFSLTGAVTGSVAGVDGSGSVSIATTATSDPTLTLAGDATGSATFTDLGDATLTVTVDGGNAQTLDNLNSLDFTLALVTTHGSTTTNSITVGGITSTGNINGNLVGNVTGTLDGDVNGSIFADDSSLIVDGVNGTVPGYLSIAEFKSIVAASTDFTDFQTRVANL